MLKASFTTSFAVEERESEREREKDQGLCNHFHHFFCFPFRPLVNTNRELVAPFFLSPVSLSLNSQPFPLGSLYDFSLVEPPVFSLKSEQNE